MSQLTLRDNDLCSESQRTLLQNALAVANRVPATNFVGGAANVEEAAWKNCWNW